MKIIKENGFLSIEAIGAVIISLLSMALGAEIYLTWCDNLEFNAAAQHLLEVEKGAKNYINDYYNDLVKATNSGTVSKITIKQLKENKYLPSSFSNKNSFGQTYTVRIKKAPPVNANPQLQAIILTAGGSPISELGVRKIATMLGAHGGYFAGESGNRVIQGALGAWSEKATAFGLDPGNGHLAAALFFIDGKSSSRDFLYRQPVPGKPELNQMQTSLEMGDQDLVNAKDIKAKGKIEANRIHSKKRLSTGDFLQIDGVANEGEHCSGKLVGINSIGRLLFCKSNQWHQVISDPHLLRIVVPSKNKVCSNDHNKQTVLKCPSGFSLTGAGNEVQYLPDKPPSYEQFSSYPLGFGDNGGWKVDVSGTRGICVTPSIICMRIIPNDPQEYYSNLIEKMKDSSTH